MCQAVPRDTVGLVWSLFGLPVPVTTPDVLCRKVWGMCLKLWSSEHEFAPCTLLIILELKGQEAIYGIDEWRGMVATLMSTSS